MWKGICSLVSLAILGRLCPLSEVCANCLPKSHASEGSCNGVPHQQNKLCCKATDECSSRTTWAKLKTVDGTSEVGGRLNHVSLHMWMHVIIATALRILQGVHAERNFF